MSIDVTWALPNCLRNASLARFASAMSDRLSLISSKTPHDACRAMASSSPLLSASRKSWMEVFADSGVSAASVESVPPRGDDEATTAAASAATTSRTSPATRKRRPRGLPGYGTGGGNAPGYADGT